MSYFWYWCVSGGLFAEFAYSSVLLTHLRASCTHYTLTFHKHIQTHNCENTGKWLPSALSLPNNFHSGWRCMGKLTFPGSRTPFAIFSLSSLHLPLLFILLLLLLLSPPLLKESISAPQLTVLFLVLCATCRLKTQLQLLVHHRNTTRIVHSAHQRAIVRAGVHADQAMCAYPTWHWWWGREGRNMGGVCRMLTKGLLNEGDKAEVSLAPTPITKSSVPMYLYRVSFLNLHPLCLPGRQLSVMHGQ